ncbi:MAG: hypothetical protein GX153_09460 [Clostridiaceae bacterium]|nr:hypothetical protein [Clostridiaceae bacterium]
MPVSGRARAVVCGILLLLVAVSAVTFLSAVLPDRPAPVTWLTSGSASCPVETSATSDTIPVYLVGEVARPGIYQVERGTYLYELVETAGGLTPRAAADRTNLVYRIEGSQLLRIPSVEDAADPGLAGSEVLSPSGQDAPFININSAGESELDGLPGIGPSTARAIIAFRETNGPFASIEEIMNVPGIKQSRFEAIRDAITT